MSAIVVGQTIWNSIANENFLVQSSSLGDNIINSGFLICRNGGVAWIVAPNTTEVSRTWYLRNDAVTTATNCTSATGWFVPTCGQLQNPGYTCRTFWDSFSSTCYWSSTECNATRDCLVNFTIGNAANYFKAFVTCVRAFRCVTY